MDYKVPIKYDHSKPNGTVRKLLDQLFVSPSSFCCRRFCRTTLFFIFLILAGLESADQSERSRFTTAEWLAEAIRETSFNNEVFAASASSSCRCITDSTRKLRAGCTALFSSLPWSRIPQITTKALCCLARLAGVSMKSMWVSVVQCDVNVYSRESSERRSLTPWVTTVIPFSLMVVFVDALVEETRASTEEQWQMMGPLVG